MVRGSPPGPPACRRRGSARTYDFGFAQYLDLETEAHQELTLPIVAAYEATKAL
ncbi:hypothetical protein ABT099_05395 [Streptomyces prasinus]|uniref:hypothetical protein n=1 Tax=Streptomyces prasinus TaxID=67345 RepID=UPI00332AE5B1